MKTPPANPGFEPSTDAKRWIMKVFIRALIIAKSKSGFSR
jgi:hypothetical protein